MDGANFTTTRENQSTTNENIENKIYLSLYHAQNKDYKQHRRHSLPTTIIPTKQSFQTQILHALYSVAISASDRCAVSLSQIRDVGHAILL
jgi:hypothetical protein